jgi:hypothetical protein
MPENSNTSIGQGTFKMKPGQNNVEWIVEASPSPGGGRPQPPSRHVPYVHIHYDDYGIYKHVIIRQMPFSDVRNLEAHWLNGRKVFLEWEVRQLIDAQGDSSAHTVADYRSHRLL